MKKIEIKHSMWEKKEKKKKGGILETQYMLAKSL